MTIRTQGGADRSAFSETRKLALNALNYAARYSMPPVPRIYEVWFTYVSGHNPGLNARIDQARKGSGHVDARTIEQVYEEHLSPQAIGGAVAEIGASLTDRLAQTADAIDGGLQSAATFSEALEAIGGGLSPEMDPASMAELIGLLGDVSRDYAAEAKKIANDLHSTRLEVANLQQKMREVREAEYLDHLTRLPNRHKLEEVLGQAVASAQLRGEPLCLVLADVDQLGALNAAWGRPSGDFILHAAADVIRANVKGRDLPAHFDGGTFAVVLPNTELSGAHALGEQIRRAFGRMAFMTADTDRPIGKVTLSLGVTQLRGTEESPALIERAAIHLALAKRSGRDQCWSAS